MIIASEYAFPLRSLAPARSLLPHSLRGAWICAIFISSFFRYPIRGGGGDDGVAVLRFAPRPVPRLAIRLVFSFRLYVRCSLFIHTVASRKRRRFSSIPSPRLPRASPRQIIRPVARSSSSPCSLFPYAFPCVSFVVSSCVSSCVSFCAFRCRRVVRRAVLPVRPVVPLVVSFRTVSLCCSLVLVSFVVAVLPCVLVRLVPPWHFVSFVVSLVVSSCSSRFCHVILFSLIRGRLVSVFMSVPVFAPFRPARRSFLFVHRFRFLCLRRGAGRCVIGRRGLPFSSHPFHLVPTRYSLVADRDAGRMWIWGAVPCCSPLVPCLSCPHRFTHLIEYHRPHMSSSSHP